MVKQAVSLICKLFGALVLAVDAAPYFRWCDARQNVEVRSSSWADTSCYETACIIQRCVYELAMCGIYPDRTAILRHGETEYCRRRPRGVWARAPVRPMQLRQDVVSRGEFYALLHIVISIGE